MNDKPTDPTDTPEEPKYTVKPSGVDPAATHLVRELKHDRGVLACRFDGEGRYVLAGAQDYLLHRWDLSQTPPETAETKEKQPEEAQQPEPGKTQWAGHESWVRAMALFPDGKRLATGDYVGRVIIWPGLDEKPEPLASFVAHQGSVRAVAVSPDEKLLATAGNDQLVCIWSAGDGSKVLELSGHGSHVYNVAFHPGGHLVSADLKGVVKHWEIPSGKLVRELDAGLLWTYSEKYTVDVGGVRGMAFSTDGSKLACAGATGDKGIAHSGSARVLLFDWKSGEQTDLFRPEKEVIATAWGVRFHPDGFVVASGGSRTGGFLWFWQPGQETEFHLLPFKTRGPGFDLDLSPDGKSLAVAHYDGAVRLYSMLPEKDPQMS